MTRSRNARRNRRARIARQTVPTTNTMAPVAVARTATTQSAGVMRQSGTDRVAHIEDVTKFGQGEIIFQSPLSPDAVGGRLGRTASLFQRVRYDRVRFEIRSQCPTNIGGGYCVAFVADPEDRMPTTDPLSYMTGHSGSKTANWWQSVIVDAPVSRDLLFTSPGEGNLRSSVPGKLVLAVDGKATAAGSMTILVHWVAQFSEPSMEEESTSSTHEITLRKDYAFWDRQNDKEQTWVTALVDDNRQYIKPADLGILAGTIWVTRPFVMMIESPIEDWWTTVTCNHVIAVDDTNGYIRPAVLYHGRIYDATNDWGNVSLQDGSPFIGGEVSTFFQGDVWREVDASGQPFNSSYLPYSRRLELVKQQRLISSTAVPPKPKIKARSQSTSQSTSRKVRSVQEEGYGLATEYPPLLKTSY